MSETKHDKDLEHVEISALGVIIHAAEQSFTEEQLFYLAEEFEVLAQRKYRQRIASDESWLPEELRG